MLPSVVVCVLLVVSVEPVLSLVFVVSVFVPVVPVDDVIEAAKAALYTGHIGDGKIFVYNVQKVVKVRTGEEGVAALQDVE